jgi:hypothetical protein
MLKIVTLSKDYVAAVIPGLFARAVRNATSGWGFKRFTEPLPPTYAKWAYPRNIPVSIIPGMAWSSRFSHQGS